MIACRTLGWSVAAAAMLALAGCGERAQTAGQPGTKKLDTQAWQGGQTAAFSADGFKAGDKTAWEAHLKARTERGQNEYTRTQK
jgi:hypothetical protein